MADAPIRLTVPRWALCGWVAIVAGCAGGAPGGAGGVGTAGAPAPQTPAWDDDRAIPDDDPFDDDQPVFDDDQPVFDDDQPVFDYDWSVQRIAGGMVGEEVELESLRGRPLVLNVWASWCPPCIRELGSFEELQAAVEARGIDATFLFVSPESGRIAAAFVEDHGWDLPFAVELRRAPASLGDLVLPTTFIVDRRGAIALRHRGATDWNQPEVIELLASLDRGPP